VVEAIDRLTADGRVAEAMRLRKVLNENGYSPAKNLAVSQLWLAKDKSKGELGAKSAENSEPAPSAELDPSPAPTLRDVATNEAQAVRQGSSELATERAQEAG